MQESTRRERMLFLGASPGVHGCYFEVAPNVYAKYAYLSNFQMKQFPNKIEFTITDEDLIKKISEFFMDMVIVQQGRITHVSETKIIKPLAHGILNFCQDMPNPLYITCPILGDSVEKVHGTYYLSKNTKLAIIGIAYESFWYGDVVSNNTDLHDIFTLDVPYLIYFNNQPSQRPCLHCKHLRDDMKFCIYESQNFSCFFGNTLQDITTPDEAGEAELNRNSAELLANFAGGSPDMYEFESEDDLQKKYKPETLTRGDIIGEELAARVK